MSLEVTNVSLFFCFLFVFFIPYSVKGADAGNVIRLFVPDIGMFIASLTIWLICRNMFQKPVTEDAAQCNMQFENEEMVSNTHFYLYGFDLIVSFDIPVRDVFWNGFVSTEYVKKWTIFRKLTIVFKVEKLQLFLSWENKAEYEKW